MLQIKQPLKLLIIALGLTTLIGCTTFQAYRIPIQQGNIITKEDVAQLKTGMSKQQVTNLLGDPVLDSTFDDNSWTYIYTEKVGGKKLVKKQVDVAFKNGKVINIKVTAQ